METEIIDKLFLELSQVTKARTQKENILEAYLVIVLQAWKDDGVKDQHGHIQLYNRMFAKTHGFVSEDIDDILHDGGFVDRLLKSRAEFEKEAHRGGISHMEGGVINEHI